MNIEYSRERVLFFFSSEKKATNKWTHKLMIRDGFGAASYSK